MILKNIHSQIKIPKENQRIIDYCYDYFKKSRHIFNYIDRECLKELKYRCELFNAIGISLVSENRDPFIVNKTLSIPIYFQKEKYDAINSDEEYREFIFQILKDGLEKGELFYNLPKKQILFSYEELKQKKFINTWLFQRKTDRNSKTVIDLVCNLSISKFELQILIKRDKKELLNKIILVTDPDEIAYHYRFKTLSFQKNRVHVLSKSGDTLFETRIGLL